ncbi:hypothetical protein A5645_22440 [Mycobacterium asiaticum]|uniref:hypothetical protein n=1 Tax=Mycobacterium asiaticum TaxID=1790 RepID=UPI0007EF7224|nr:hypothetical protein [Mycobacterium asiaticum]OBK92768.1 hypothetical protein A5645_22440 [Mycobacterium asiaticum]
MGFGMPEEDLNEQEAVWEGRRHALAQLLQARGHAEAAAVVAVSHYRSDIAWDGDNDYQVVTLTVPPKLFDAASKQLANAICESCIDVVGGGAISMQYRVASPPYAVEWIAVIVGALERRWVPSQRGDAGEIGQIDVAPYDRVD